MDRIELIWWVLFIGGILGIVLNKPDQAVTALAAALVVRAIQEK